MYGKAEWLDRAGLSCDPWWWGKSYKLTTKFGLHIQGQKYQQILKLKVSSTSGILRLERKRKECCVIQ